MADTVELLDLSEFEPDYEKTPGFTGRRGSLTGRFPIFDPTGRGAVDPSPIAPALSPEDQAIVSNLPDKRVQNDQPAPTVMASRNRIERALAISATLNIPFADAYDNEPGYTKAMDEGDKDWFKLAGRSFMRGLGGLYVTAGRAAQWAGINADEQIDFGKRLQRAYMPTVKAPELSWRNAFDPTWWATTAMESVPSMLSLIPASIVAAYGGGATATAVGMGMFGRTVLASLAGGVVSRFGEGGLEAGQGYEEALAKGKTKEEAEQIATRIFNANFYGLSGVDAAEFALSLTPLHKLLGAQGSKSLTRRVLATVGKLGGVGTLEAGEEMFQDAIQQWARGEPVRVTKEMQEAGYTGFVFGVGMGGAGSVYNALTSKVEGRMPADVARAYQEQIAAGVTAGKEMDVAKREALDTLASTPDGAKLVKETVEDLKAQANGEPPHVPTQDEMNQAIEGQADAETFETADIPQHEIDALMAEHFEPIARGELSSEELFGEDAPPADMVKRAAPEGAQHEYDFAGAFKGSKPSEGYVDSAWQRVQEGKKQLFSDKPGLEQKIQAAVDAGQIKSRHDIRRIVDEHYAAAEPRVPFAQRENFLVSEEGFKQAVANIREKSRGLHAGIDPTVFLDAVRVGVFFLEKGVRKLADFTNILVETLGEDFREHARAIYQRANREIKTSRAAEQRLKEITSKGLIIGRQDRQTVRAAIQRHVEMLGETNQPLTYKGQRFDKAVPQKRSVRLIGPEGEKVIRGQEIMNIEEILPFDVPGENLDAYPLSEHAMTFKKMAQQLEAESTQKAKDVKKTVRMTTGQQRIVKMIGEDVALRAAFKKAEQAARVAFREGNKAGVMAARADMQDLMLKAKAKAEAAGFWKGEAYGSRTTGKELRELFREKEKYSQETRKAAVELIKEHLPPELRGKFLDAVIAKVTERKTNDLLDRIAAAGEKYTKDELIAELSRLKDRSGSIDVEYQKRINDLLKDINLKKINDHTKRKIQALQTLGDEQEFYTGLSGADLELLDRLNMRQASEMSVEELKGLADIAKRLTALGKVKARLKNNNNKRIREKNRAELLASTRNLDPDPKSKETRLGIAQRFISNLHYRLLNPLRAFESFDGYRKGVNYKYGAKLAHAETNAQFETHKIMQAAVDEMQAAGITEIDENRNAAIMANIRAREGADQAALTIMEQNGWTELPELTEKEEKLIEILKKYSNRKQTEVAAYWENRNGEPFPYLENRILPLKYEGEFNRNPNEIMLNSPHRSQTTEQGFGMERKAGVKKIPRTDVMAVFEQGINEVEWWLNVQPELDEIGAIVANKEFAEKAGQVVTNYWLDHLDIMSRRGWSKNASFSDFTSGLRHYRGNISKAILGYRLSSILVQPLAAFDAAAYASAEWGPTTAARVFGEVAKTWINPAHARSVVGQSKALQERRSGGEVQIDELLASAKPGNLKDKIIKGGMKFLQVADVKTAAGVQEAVKKILEDQGVPNAASEAETIMNIVSSSSDVAHRPHVLAQGEGARTWFTFQTFMLARWGLIAHDIVQKGFVHGDGAKKLSAAAALGLLIAGKYAEDETREFIYERVKGRELKAKDLPFYVDALYSVASSVPYFGNLFEMYSSRGGSSEMPILKLVGDALRAVKAPLEANERSKQEKVVKAMVKGIEAGAEIFVGAPGTSQLFDILERLLFPEEEGSRAAGGSR